MIGGPRRERHDRVRGILLRRRRKDAAVDDLEVRHVGSPAGAVDDGRARVGSHTAAAKRVVGGRGRRNGQNLRARTLENPDAPAHHVVEQFLLVAPPLDLSPRQRQTELVAPFRIEIEAPRTFVLADAVTVSVMPK